MTTAVKVQTTKHSKLPFDYLLKASVEEYRDVLSFLDKEERVQLVLDNPVLFGEYYIRPYTRKWNTDTADHQYYMLEEMMLHDNIVIHVPVEHAKSTWFSLVVPLWFLCRDRNTQGCIISNTARQAEGFLRAIKWHIEYNHRFKEDFGDYIVPRKPTKNDPDGKWTESIIFVHRDKDMQSKDPTMLAIGTGGALLGARLDWVIADDILDLKNTQTEILRKKVSDWWLEIVDSRVVEDGRKIVLGTLQHTKDLLCNLSDNEEYFYVHLSALDKDKLTTLWPEKWPYERVMKKKKTIGTIKWLKTLQNDRTAIAANLFNVGWLNYYTELPQRRMKIFIGIDPAICDDRTTAEEKQQDKFGLVVVGFDGHHVFLLEEFEEWLTFPEQLKLIKAYNEKWKPFKIGIESVQYQKALAQQAMLLQGLPPVLAVKVGTQSKATRIEAFSVHCENKRFWIHESHHLFIEQFLSFEPGVKSPNVLDACVIAMIMITSKGTLKDVQLIKNNIEQCTW
jgi:phage terminase large subunit-like protein